MDFVGLSAFDLDGRGRLTLAPLLFIALRCFGPLLIAASTALVNRSQPSGRNSILDVSLLDRAPMADKPREIDPELLRLLGRLVTRWSFLEALLNEFLVFLLGADKGMAYVLTQSVSGATVVDCIRTILHIRITNDVVRKGILDLLTRIDGVRAERNALVHGLWSDHLTEAGTATVQTVRWDRAEVIKHELVTAPDLNEVIDEIGQLIGEVLILDDALNFTGRRSKSSAPS